jgi:lactate dehydrogenase-like 2-hydroxyacid dehydrogenase
MLKFILVKAPVFDGLLTALGDEYEIKVILDDHERAKFVAKSGKRVDSVLTNGTKGMTAEEMSTMPNLKLVSCFGAGYEGVDIAAAKQRGIALSHGPGVNDVCVADHAMALLFAIVRRIVQSDTKVHNGGWKSAEDTWPRLSEKTLGILGLGRIGLRIAARAQGFDMKIHYHNRSERSDVDYVYEKSAMDLAAVSDFLIVVAPGGPETYHLINAKSLKALGPEGYLVNVGRGSVVDNDDLVAALKDGTIAAAGLDVFEGEPSTPQILLDAPNLTITPHVAGRAPESQTIMVDLYKQNLANFFAGKLLETPVPGSV